VCVRMYADACVCVSTTFSVALMHACACTHTLSHTPLHVHIHAHTHTHIDGSVNIHSKETCAFSHATPKKAGRKEGILDKYTTLFDPELPPSRSILRSLVLFGSACGSFRLKPSAAARLQTQDTHTPDRP